MSRSPRHNFISRKTNRANLADKIVRNYRPSDGCPPLQKHWGGFPLTGSPWLKSFADAVAHRPSCAGTWDALSAKCDTSWLIDLLYVFTIRAEVDTEKHQESSKLYKKKLDELVPMYDKLLAGLDGLLNSSEISSELKYDRQKFAEQVRFFKAAKRHLENVIRRVLKFTSKGNARDWYLHLISATIEQATGSKRVNDLTNLIEAARSAHGEKKPLFTDEVVKQRIQRYRKRMGIAVPAQWSKRKKRPAPESGLLVSEMDRDIPF